MKHLMLFEAYTSYQTKLMNDLLDKGYNNLSEIDKEKLRNIDKQKEPKVQKDPDVQRLINPRGEWRGTKDKLDNFKPQNKEYTDSTDTIKFKLVATAETPEFDVYQGEIHYDGVEYFGYVFKDKVTEEQTYKFQSMDNREFEPADYDLHYEFDDLLQQICYDENIK